MSTIVLEFANVNMIASSKLLEAVLSRLPAEEADYNVEIWVQFPGYHNEDDGYNPPEWQHAETTVMTLPEQYQLSLFGQAEEIVIQDLLCAYGKIQLFRIVITPSTNAGAGHMVTRVGDPD